MISRLAALPAVRKLAEEQAQEHHTALVAAMTKRDGSVSFSLTVPPVLVDAQTALLSDLSRPASRDALARLVAEAVRIHLWAVHLILLGGTDYPPEWPASLTDALAGATDRDALALIALHVLGADHG